MVTCAVIGCALPALSVAVKKGRGVLPDRKADFHWLGLLLVRSNFQTLPFKSPAYTCSTVPSEAYVNPGLDNPLELALPPTPVSILASRAPVSSLYTYSTAFSLVLLYPLPKMTTLSPLFVLAMVGRPNR